MIKHNDIETYLLIISEKAEKAFKLSPQESVSVNFIIKDNAGQKPFVQGWLTVINNDTHAISYLSNNYFHSTSVIQVLDLINFYLESFIDKMASGSYLFPEVFSYEDAGFGD